MSFHVENLTVSFPGVGTVVDGVSLALEPGRSLAVVGESGAGKSVFARALLGLASEGGATARVTADALTVAGRDMRGASARSWRRLRGDAVGFVLQDALGSLDPLRTIGAEVGEPLRIHRHLPRAQVMPRVLDALTRAGLPDASMQARRYSWELSGGMRQRALIASAIISSPGLLIADEPTTALDATVARGVQGTLAELKTAGTALLLITHDLQVAAHLADDIAVFEAGRLIEYGPTTRVLSAPAQRATRGLVGAIPRGAKPTARAAPPGDPVLAARDLSKTYRLPGGGSLRAVDGVSLHLGAGEVLGIAGESGSGKSTLARLLLGAEPPDTGEVTLAGEPWVPGPERSRRARRSLIRLVPQDPLGSFDPRRSVSQILADSLRRAPSSAALLTPRDLLAAVQLDPEVLSRRPRSLSGGMRQRVAIARALATDPRVLVLDEPVSALDVTVQANILRLLAGLQAERGVAMVFVSHDLAVVRQVSDRVAVMAAGRIVETGPTEQVWATPAHDVTRELLAAAHSPEALGARDIGEF